MKNLLMLGVIGLVAFGAALGAGWWMNQPAGEGGHADAHGDSHDSHGDSHAEPSHGGHAAVSTTDSHGSHGISNVPAHDVETDLPLAVRPRPISTQEIFEIAMRLQEREAAVAQREQQLQQREDRVNLLLEDLKNEQQLIEGLRAEVRSLLNSGEELTTQISLDQQALATRQAELEALAPANDSAAAQPVANPQNIRMIAETLKSIEPARAGQLLTSFANNGDMDFVIQVYAQLGDRDAAKILETITDETLITDIINGMRDYERPTAAGPSGSNR